MTLQETNSLPEPIRIFIQQEFFSTGKPPTLTHIQTSLNLTREETLNFAPLINDYKQLHNLNEPINDLLTLEQFKVVQMVLNTTDRRSIRTKLKEAGVTVAEYNKWRTQPHFMNYVRTITAKKFKDADATADIELVKLLEDGDLKAITYYNDITGRHQSAEAVNITRVLALVMEVLVQFLSAEQLRLAAGLLEERLNGVIDVSSEPRLPSPSTDNIPFSLNLKVREIG